MIYPKRLKEGQRALSLRQLDPKEYYKQWYQLRKDIYKEKHLQKAHGISLEDLFKLLDDQNYLCAICKIDLSSKNPKNVHVDHCHKTKKIRGVLCNSCNMALGLLKDDTNIVKSCLEYLECHRT